MYVNNCVGLIIFCIVFLVFIIIFGFFALFTDIIGKHISRYCSLGTIIFLELGISLYSLFLFLDNKKNFIIIFSVSLFLVLIDLFGILFSIFFGSSDEDQKSQNQINNTNINSEAFKHKNELTEKIELKNDFESTPADNNFEEKKYNPTTNNITMPHNDYNDIERVESNYSNAPPPVNLLSEN